MAASTPLPQSSADASLDRLPPAERLLCLWEQGIRTDLDAFVASSGPLSAADLAAVLYVDQHQRWQTGERTTVESYLQRFPILVTDAEAVVDVIFHEYLLRERLGECPTPLEYADRFPTHADALQAQIAFHRLLKDSDPSLAEPRLGASTLPNPLQGAMPTNRAAQAPIDLVVRGGLSSQWEIRPLLHKRLRLIALVTCPIFVLGLLILWPQIVGPWLRLLYVTIAVGSTVSAILLSRRRPMSLRMLRLMEAVLVGSTILFFGAQDVQFFQSNWFAILAERGSEGAKIAARCQGLPWLVMIISYGILIPNTARRCLVAVTLIVVIRLAILLGVVLAFPTVARTEAAFVSVSVAEMVVAVAIAIFGAHRIETLQRAASGLRTLGPYRLTKRLGAGGMGEVYLAEHALLRRPCALKLIRPERVGDTHFLARFEREVQAMATLTHPNTVRIYDYGLAADGTFYYAMEYLPGLSLQELVTRYGPLPPERAVCLLRQLCGALREAHAAGLVHRDIKPANILVCQTGGMHDVAKLLDFGLVHVNSLSQDGSGLTGVGTIAGTPAFMSPEQAAGATEVDPRSDIYSLGAVAYFLLTGRSPFVHATSVETMAAHLTEPVVSPSSMDANIPIDLDHVILRCLAKQPQQRFGSVVEVDEALARLAYRGDWSPEQAADWWRNHERPR